MPSEAVGLAVAQVAEENRLNEEEYQSEDGGKILNLDPTRKPAVEAPAPEVAPP